MNELYYVYPMYKKGSFHFISKEHIRYLKSNVKIQEIDESVLDNLMWIDGKSILLHPIGYFLLGDKEDMFKQRLKRLEKLLLVKDILGGFDTADSDKISSEFVNVLNKLDLVIVPSGWAKHCYLRSGVKTAVEVLPHGLSDALLDKTRQITHNAIKQLLQLKQKHDAKLVLFFLIHSGWRKGADLVARALYRIQKQHKNVFLVVKRAEGLDPYLNMLKNLRMIEIAGWLSNDELRQLYDACDVCVCPSRGGGFELNALEAIARGLPTLVPHGMCFLDYLEYTIPVKLERRVRVLPYNPIHVGRGFEVNINDFTDKLFNVVENLEHYKMMARKFSEHIRKQYAWFNVCERLYKILQQYNFV